MTTYIGAIDQGTTSTRFIVFSSDGAIVGSHAMEHRQIYPQQGWLEHDPVEIWRNTETVIREALEQLSLTPADLAAVGITNQRETTVVWNRRTGKPVYNAIVWSDTRTLETCERLSEDGGQSRFARLTGLPVVPYFSASKIQWILNSVEGVRAAAQAGDIVFGNIDTWLIWNLTGGVRGGMHITDVTNASRTLLMNIKTLKWEPSMLEVFTVPACMLPEIRSSSEVYGTCTGVLEGVKVAGVLGDQQAALFGQACFSRGQAKCTYGTGGFLLSNTGTDVVFSKNGMLTTVAYKIGDAPTVYGLEGSVAVAGSLVQWLRDNLNIISDAPEVETLARSVSDNGGVYFVPAFSGLFAPHWRNDARGAIVGLTAYASKAHIARAALESTAFQVRDVLSAMRDDGVETTRLKVDGGMTANGLLMQFQADVLNTQVVRSKILETTALGAAYAAGLAVGVFDSLPTLASQWAASGVYSPSIDEATRASALASWNKAVTKSFGWVDGAGPDDEEECKGGEESSKPEGGCATAACICAKRSGLAKALVVGVLIGVAVLVGARMRR